MNKISLIALIQLKRVAALALLVVCPAVQAADDVWQTRETNALWKNECGSCHMAFPPALLSGDNWQVLMQNLDKHYGVNAAVDVKSRDEIAAFLERNAGSGWNHSVDSMRITETGWFIKKHQSSIRMVTKGRVKSLVDCAACHQ